MSKRIITFAEEDAYTRAEEYFIKNCGIDFSVEKHRRMYSNGMDVRRKGVHGIQIVAAVAKYGAEAFVNSGVEVGGERLSCNAFEQIAPGNVVAVYLYMLSAGECSCDPEDKIANRLFADIWGSAYTAAGKDLLEELIAAEAKTELTESGEVSGFLSKSFGPGYYGMGMEQNHILGRMLGNGEIGVEIRDSGIMLPIKSCSGVYFVVRDQYGLPGAECKDCAGNSKGCAFCHVKVKNNQTADKTLLDAKCAACPWRERVDSGYVKGMGA